MIIFLKNGHREVVSILLEEGADINAQNEDHDSPMHLALRTNHIEIVYMLLRNGGNSKLKGFNNKDCVECAKDMKMFDLVKALRNFSPSMGMHAYSSPSMRNN